MVDLRNAISPNRAARAPRQALRSFRPGCQDPGPGRPPGTTSREDIPGRPGVYTHTPNSTVFSTISTKYRAGPRSGSRVSAPGAVVAARRLRRARVRPLPLGLVLLVLWSYSSLKEAMMYTCIDVDRVVGFALVDHGGRDLTGGGRQ